LRLLPALVVGYLIMGLLWPWSILAPLNPMRAAEYFDKFFEKPWREMFAGKLYSVTAMPASYLPHLFAIKLPEIMLALGLAGTAGALVVIARRDLPLNRRAGYVLVTSAAILPVLLAMVAHPAFYNGLRHFVFVVPPFAVLGGLAGAWLFEKSRPFGKSATAALTVAFVGGLALPLSDMVRLHPYQYTAFNWASGGGGLRPCGPSSMRCISSHRRDDAGPSRSAARNGRRKWRSAPTSKLPGTANAPTSP
jgi:hypothetical protein